MSVFKMIKKRYFDKTDWMMDGPGRVFFIKPENALASIIWDFYLLQVSAGTIKWNALAGGSGAADPPADFTTWVHTCTVPRGDMSLPHGDEGPTTCTMYYFCLCLRFAVQSLYVGQFSLVGTNEDAINSTWTA